MTVEQDIDKIKDALEELKDKVRIRDYIKCSVRDCENVQGEGEFFGFLCSPCHRFVSYREGAHSQAFRNEQEQVSKALEFERKLHKESMKPLEHAQNEIKALKQRLFNVADAMEMSAADYWSRRKELIAAQMFEADFKGKGDK